MSQGLSAPHHPIIHDVLQYYRVSAKKGGGVERYHDRLPQNLNEDALMPAKTFCCIFKHKVNVSYRELLLWIKPGFTTIK